MDLAVVTAGDGPFDGAFWTAYREHYGPAPDTIFLLPSQSFRPAWQAALEPFVFFGPSYLARLIASDLVGVPLTRADRASGLHRSLREVFPTVEYREVESLNRGEGLQTLTAIEPDLLVSVGSPEIFEPQVLEAPGIAALNIHNGELPEYRGLFGTFWEVYEGEETGGVTLHHMVPEVDSGPIVRSEKVSLDGNLFKILLRKKWLGGKMLAASLRDGRLTSDGTDGTRTASGTPESDYYSWPTLRQVFRMRRRLSSD